MTAIRWSPASPRELAALVDSWEFLGRRDLDRREARREARLEDVGELVAWLRLPAAGSSGAAAMLTSPAPEVSVATTNRKLAAARHP